MKIYFKMKHFIVIQMTIEKEEIVGSRKNTIMQNIVRQIKAESKEIAIGKFVIATQDVKAIKKLEIECYDLSELKSVD
jgi:hypothetical protein